MFYFKKKKRFQSQNDLILFDVRAMMFALKKINTNHPKCRRSLIPTTEKMSSGWPVDFNVEAASSYSELKCMT